MSIGPKHSRRTLGALRGGLALGICIAFQPLSAYANTGSTPDPESAPIFNATSADEAKLFARYSILDPKVAFWTRVFGQWSDNESVVHWVSRPNVVFRVLDFGPEARIMDESAFQRFRREKEREATSEMSQLLQRVHTKRGTPESLEGEERRLYRLMAGVEGDEKFLAAAQDLRVQRGLADRTLGALEISGRYLPFMESVFESYGLPRGLTRLPLVESSFNVNAYSKVGAAGLWQFMPSSARFYMRLDKVVDDRRDPWVSTDAAARHLRDDYALLKSWPLALTAYNYGRGGVARGLAQVGGTTLADLIRDYEHPRFGFASRNFYAEFLAAYDVERDWQMHFGEVRREVPVMFDEVRIEHYVPYETLRRVGGVDAEEFRRLNPAYQGKVLKGQLYVPPDHVIRLPPGKARDFQAAYARLDASERFDKQRVNHFYHRVARGQTLSGIASKYNVSMASIRTHNRIGRNNLIRVGQRLKIVPPGGILPDPVFQTVQAPAAARSAQTHSVRPGQTLSEIAAKYDVSQAAIRARNDVGADGLIRVGQNLTIVGGSQMRQHSVRSGQTLGEIARHYGVSVASIRKANGMGNSSLIRVGQALKIVGGKPAFHVHEVRSGQTLGSIARKYGVTVSSIRSANDLGRSNLIRIGQQLRVPLS